MSIPQAWPNGAYFPACDLRQEHGKTKRRGRTLGLENWCRVIQQIDDKPEYQVRVRVRSEVAPVTAIDIIVNGQVSKHVDLASEVGQGKWIEV
ncbi:MAG TPA: hypothetical protein VM260_28235 [Pirellula sp.]|nr:hypothetical protein [Pirellula sp.]